MTGATIDGTNADAPGPPRAPAGGGRDPSRSLSGDPHRLDSNGDGVACESIP